MVLDRENLDIVGAEADVLRSNEAGDIVDVAEHTLGSRLHIAEVGPNSHDADDATPGRAGADLLVTDVSKMRTDRVGVRVRKDHGPLAQLDRLERGASACVGT